MRHRAVFTFLCRLGHQHVAGHGTAGHQYLGRRCATVNADLSANRGSRVDPYHLELHGLWDTGFSAAR